MRTIKTNSYDDLKNITVKKALEYSILTRRKGNFTLTIVYCEPDYKLTGLVFANGRMIAEYPQFDYFELFRSGKRILEEWKKEIFTVEELGEPLKDYTDYRQRSDFIINKLPEEYDHIDIFQKDFENNVKKYPFKSIFGIDNFKNKDEADLIDNLFIENLKKHQKAFKEDDDYFRDAVNCELANFEVSVSGDPGEALKELDINPRDLSKVRLGILNDELNKCD
jgi:hypothetical protein